MGWGRGTARRADRPIFQMYRAAPKGAALPSIPYTSTVALQDSRRGGGGGGGGTHTNQILFSPPIVCVQWPIIVLHTKTNPAYPSPHRTPHRHIPWVTTHTYTQTHTYASMLTGSSRSFNAPSSQSWLSGNRHVTNGPAELVSAASSILCCLSNISSVSQLSRTNLHSDWWRLLQPLDSVIQHQSHIIPGIFFSFE